MDPYIFRQLSYDYCLAFSASETSGYRTVDHNHDVGGTPGSPHVAGVAVDVVYDGGRPGPEADAWLKERGLRRISEADHDHIQPVGWVNHPA